MLEDKVVSVSAIGWEDSFFRDGHTLRSLDIYLDVFSHNFHHETYYEFELP